jgi:hypothetical protein
MKMKDVIIRLNLQHLRNEVHVEMNEEIFRPLRKYNPATLGVTLQYNRYKTAYDAEVAVLDVILKSEYTAEIHDQDHRRDGIYRGFSDEIQSSCRHFNPEKREAGLRVKNVLDHYGNISAKPLDQETAAIDDLLRELTSGVYPPLITTLGCGDWLTQLDIENKALKALMAKRYDESAKRPTTNMRITRQETDRSLHALFDQIEALVLVNGITAYEPFIRDVNAILERYKNILAQEAGRRATHEK